MYRLNYKYLIYYEFRRFWKIIKSMKMCYDGRVLTHRKTTGVERFTRELMDNLGKFIELDVKAPSVKGRFLQHLWEHFILPLQCRNAKFFLAPSNVGPVILPKRCKYILVVHDVAYANFPLAYSRLFSIYYNKVIPIAIKRADVVITVSYSEKKNILKLYPFAKDKIKVIYPGLSNKLFLSKTLPFDRREAYFLYVGSLNPRKNLRNLLKGYRIFKEKSKIKMGLKVVGASYSIFKNVDTEFSEDADVEYLGYVSESELYNLYKRAMAFVFPSFYEGFGYPPLEAMSFGTPTIVSNISSLPEVTKGKALYVDPYSPEDIADKMIKIGSNRSFWEELSENGREVARLYTWEKTVAEFNKVIKLLNGG